MYLQVLKLVSTLMGARIWMAKSAGQEHGLSCISSQQDITHSLRLPSNPLWIRAKPSLRESTTRTCGTCKVILVLTRYCPALTKHTNYEQNGKAETSLVLQGGLKLP